jgi:competence protein ComEC
VTEGSPADAPALDVRLAIGAAAAWIAVAVLVAGSVRPALLAAGGAAATAAVALRWWRLAAARVVALGGCVVALVLLVLAGHLERAASSPVHALARSQAEVTMILQVTDDPRPVGATGDSGAPRVAVSTRPVAVAQGGGLVGTPGGAAVLVLADAAPWRDVLPGQRVLLSGQLVPSLDGGLLQVTMFARDPPQLLGRPPWYQRLAGTVRAGLRRAVGGLPDQERGLLPGLVDGDITGLDPVLSERFRLAGLTHLVAVSGTNCSLLLGAVLLVLRRARARPWVCAVVGATVLALFVVVARPSPSVLRAALMAGLALFALATGRPRAAVPSLSAATVVLLIRDPALATSASFAMSVLATGALLVIAPGWAAALRRRRVPVGVAESVAVAAAAHVVTAPVVAAISGSVSVVAVVANVLAEPVVGPITVLGFVAAVLAPLWLAPASALAWLAGWPCRWLVFVADTFGGMHGAVVPWPGGMVGGLALLALVAVLWAAATRLGARRVLAAAALTAGVILFPVRAATTAWPPPGWVFVACDVGQGDGLVLNAGPGAAVEIDAGPDPVLIDRCLRDLHVTRIPLLVLTHMHIDHVGGLAGAVRGRTVGALLTGPLDAPESGSHIVRSVADRLGLKLRTPAVGTSLTVGDVRLDVLGPPYAFTGTRSDPNNSSLVLRATVHGLRIMLPGDAEVEEQDWLLGSGENLRADVLKVPHHGSAYSDPAFLAAVHARVGVISVGAHNDYGHPSPLTLAALARLGVPALRTDQDGDVAVAVQDGRLVTVVRGLRASTPGLADAPRVASVAGVRMASCPPVPPPPPTCRARCRRSSCSSVTRSYSSTVPCARSPPRRGEPTRPLSRPRSPAASCRAASCTSCSARRCSASRAWSSSARPRTSVSPRPPC